MHGADAGRSLARAYLQRPPTRPLGHLASSATWPARRRLSGLISPNTGERAEGKCACAPTCTLASLCSAFWPLARQKQSSACSLRRQSGGQVQTGLSLSLAVRLALRNAEWPILATRSLESNCNRAKWAPKFEWARKRLVAPSRPNDPAPATVWPFFVAPMSAPPAHFRPVEESAPVCAPISAPFLQLAGARFLCTESRKQWAPLGLAAGRLSIFSARKRARQLARQRAAKRRAGSEWRRARRAKVGHQTAPVGLGRLFWSWRLVLATCVSFTLKQWRLC